MKTNVKHIFIHAKEWFDKTNANSYFAAKVYVDHELFFELPFRYGYDEQYVQESMQKLVSTSILESGNWQEIRSKKIDLICKLETGCKKSEVKSFVK